MCSSDVQRQHGHPAICQDHRVLFSHRVHLLVNHHLCEGIAGQRCYNLVSRPVPKNTTAYAAELFVETDAVVSIER